MKLFTLVFAYLLITHPLSAQKQILSVALAPSAIIKLIDLEGEITLINSQTDSLVATTEYSIEGSTIGYSNQKSRGTYELIIQHDSNCVVLKPKKRKDAVSIGISYWTENIKTTIAIPARADVRVSNNNANLVVKGCYDLFDANVEQGKITLQLSQKKIRRLVCNVRKGSITVGEHEYKEDFSFTGEGNSIYTIANKKGDVVINLLGE